MLELGQLRGSSWGPRFISRILLLCRVDASKWGLVRSRSVTRAAAAGTFPCQLCTTTVSDGKACQDLVTTGSRLFGLGGFGSALRVRIYDFAVYIHPEQVSAICSFSLQLA